MRTRYRSIFLSDIHLGSSTTRAEDLASFLRHVTCDHLYLVGDVLDMWRLRQRWRWPESHNTVVRRLLKLAARGVRITYVPGNHDDAARPYAGLEFGGIRVELNAAHRTADGRLLLVSHGDQYDLVVRNHRWLGLLGAAGYDLLLGVNRLWNAARARLGLPYHSLAQAVKLRVKRACTFVSHFEEELRAEAHRDGFDGVVCGHIHKAELRADRGFIYANCGDWVESCTAIVEHDDGKLELLDAAAFVRSLAALRHPHTLPIEEPEPWPTPSMPFPLPAAFGGSTREAASSS